jgi:hypothetical protein
MALGEAEVAQMEGQLAEHHRELAYRNRVESMERVVRLRSRELAAQAKFEKLR